MEFKLLRLGRQQRRQPGIAGGTTTITDRLPPIAATPSTPNQSDEEADSFEELELTPRGTNRQGAGLFTHGGMTHRGVMGPARQGTGITSQVIQFVPDLKHASFTILEDLLQILSAEEK